MEIKNRLQDYYSREQLEQMKRLLSGCQFTVLNVSLWRQQAPWGTVERRVNDNFILIVKKGQLHVNVDGLEKLLSPNDGMAVAEFVPQSYGFAPGIAEVETFILHVLCDHPQGENAFKYLSSPFFTLPFPEAQMHSLCQMIALRNIHNGLALSHCAGWVINLFLGFLETGQYCGQKDTPIDPRIITALAFIRKNLGNNISVVDIAASAGLKEVQFRNLFVKCCGHSPIESLRQARLGHALRLLTRYDLPLSDIAGQCGFQSLAYFCCTFRKFFGITPEQYRQKNR